MTADIFSLRWPPPLGRVGCSLLVETDDAKHDGWRNVGHGGRRTYPPNRARADSRGLSEIRLFQMRPLPKPGSKHALQSRNVCRGSIADLASTRPRYPVGVTRRDIGFVHLQLERSSALERPGTDLQRAANIFWGRLGSPPCGPRECQYRVAKTRRLGMQSPRDLAKSYRGLDKTRAMRFRGLFLSRHQGAESGSR